MGCLEDNEAHQDERLGDDVSCRFFVGRAPLLFGMSLRNRVGLHPMTAPKEGTIWFWRRQLPFQNGFPS